MPLNPYAVPFWACTVYLIFNLPFVPAFRILFRSCTPHSTLSHFLSSHSYLKEQLSKYLEQYQFLVLVTMVSVRSILLAGAGLLTVAFASPVANVGQPKSKRQSDTLCGYGTQGIKQPAANSTIQQNEDSTTFEVVYCSGQYFKTSSIDGSVLLHYPGRADSGQLLVTSQAPDNQDAPSGYYSYRFNVTIYPEDG